LETSEYLSKKLKIVIADDEALARTRISKFLKAYKSEAELIEASNGKETIAAINENLPDIVFLDIKMTDMNGFEVLRQIHPDTMPIIIFVTAFNDFAVKAFEVQAIDFLLKPYKKQRFLDALDRGLKQMELESREKYQHKLSRLMEYFDEEKIISESGKNSYLNSVVLKKNKKYYFINVSDIMYIKSAGYYAEIFTVKKEKHVHRISMGQFIDQLDPRDFSRINRSSIVPMKNIKEIISEGLGDYSIRMNDGETFPIGKNYKNDILKKMGIK
jgi:two-component system LytT family response regulator